MAFENFFSSFMVFQFLFAVVFSLIVFSIIYQILRSRNIRQPETIQNIIKEREIIKEIVKIRCQYCNNLYDETEEKCPHCGGTKP